jgi:hypothetical protein
MPGQHRMYGDLETAVVQVCRELNAVELHVPLGSLYIAPEQAILLAGAIHNTACELIEKDGTAPPEQPNLDGETWGTTV